MHDDEIKDLIEGCKERANKVLDKKGNGKNQMMKLRQDRLERQHQLMESIEEQLLQYKKDIRQVNAQQLTAQLRGDEFANTCQIFSKIDFADIDSIKKLYIYMYKDEQEHNNEADFWAKIYKDSKFDAQKMKYTDPRNLKKKRQKNKLPP